MPQFASSSIFKLTGIIFILCICAHVTVLGQSPDSAQTKYLAEMKTTGSAFSGPFQKNFVQNYALPEKAFLAKMDSARATFLTVLAHYQKELKPDFAKQQEQVINYYIDKLVIDYPNNYNICTGKAFPYESDITRRLKHYLPDFNNPALINNPAFRDYAKAFFSFQLVYELKKPAYIGIDNRALHAILNVIPRFVTNAKCRAFWQYDYLYNHINTNGIKNIEKIYSHFITTCPDTAYISRIKGLYTTDHKGRQGHIIRTYKTAGPYKLDMHIFLPDSGIKGKKKQVMVYFHAGNWQSGKPDQFFGACKADARKGWVACAVEYRLHDRQGSLPFEAVKDARSAIRWLRQHAVEFNIDTSKIVASGYAAGGHLALTCAMANKYNEQTDNLHYSPAPNLIMVTSGIYDLTDINTAWIRKDLKNKDEVKDITPNYLVKAGMPHILIIHGTADGYASYTSAKFFESQMVKVKNQLSFHSFKGAGHFLWLEPKYSTNAEQDQQAFLKKNGY